MTAENGRIEGVAARGPFASMRPRPMTAENGRGRGPGPPAPAGFNEAAADDRGKLGGSRRRIRRRRVLQ